MDRKLKGAEQREESLIKRITEKDKAISKMRYINEKLPSPKTRILILNFPHTQRRHERI